MTTIPLDLAALLANDGNMLIYVRFLIACVALVLLGSCASVQFVKHISPGLTYERIVTEQGQTVHVATVDPSHYQLTLYKTQKSELKPVSHVAQENHAIFAINAGFFAKDGGAVGMLKINGTIISKPSKKRGVFGWNDKGEFFFDRLGIHHESKAIVGEFGPESWWNRTENIIGGAPLMLYNGHIIEVESEGTLTSFLKEQYARTAVCVDLKKNIKLVVVNGGDRNTNKMGTIEGMSIHELAQFMREQGCLHALNLDGGYSSSFVYEGVRQNSFSAAFVGERPVATMILVSH